MVSTPDGQGYWQVDSAGGVFPFGDATFHGSAPALGLNVNDVVGMAPTRDGQGYWLVESNGGILTFGDATFHGSGFGLATDVVGMARTPTGNGYWLVESNGGVLSYGDATFHGSGFGLGVNDIVGMAPTADGNGYWLVGSDGMIFPFGDAQTYASSLPTATYTATETIPVPPASNFAGASGGGDGWAVGLTSSRVFNVFHHSGITMVNCHNQSDASACWSAPKTVTDASGNNFSTSIAPGLFVAQDTGHLYVPVVRTSDNTAGVLCIDTTQPDDAPGSALYCGFTALTPAGEGSNNAFSANGLSAPVQVGSHWYFMNEVPGVPTGAEDNMLCFDLAAKAACANQPYPVDRGGVNYTAGSYSYPIGAAGSRIFVQIVGTTDKLACFNTTSPTVGTCGGSWPVTVSGGQGAPYPLLDGSGNVLGVCDPLSTIACFDLSGASVATPPGMASAIGGTVQYSGPAAVIGPRVYVPEAFSNAVGCYDYSLHATCANFPKTFQNLGLLYTVNPDPARPTCLWVNADNGADQIQDFDAYTGGACGHGSIRVLASQFVVNTPLCTPASYTKIQILQPTPSQYSPTSSTVAFDDGDANPITTITPNPQNLDSTGAVSLVGMGLNTATGLPQFLFTLNGLTGQPGAVQVQLTWTGTYDTSCVGPNTTVTGADKDLGITNAPANVTTDATSPGGAPVTYTAPTATDESGDSPTATVSCDHASGSAFPIGTTTVSCTATDADDSNSPVSATFTVTVKGALTQLQDLKGYVTGIGPGTSLADKVQTAINYDQAGDIADTCSELTALIKETNAQSGKDLPAAQATTIITDAERIRAVLGC